jgi:hypothetical protein
MTRRSLFAVRARPVAVALAAQRALMFAALLP